ncbi:hypothetical protein [Ruminococcus sp.]|uniref:hypothetical protein n=1 Tax=Ruminococcus sp. TaxID=41978 RepID=UPI0025CDA5A3|nr:hypothetical protein [Ruminococcus sp.]MCI5816012.1 hypothetical protein [Ruminococcus sp.]
MQDYIYVLLSQTGTNVAKIIRFFTRKPYNHASIAADSSLNEMYSFCRNSPSMPLPATFNQEIVGHGTLGKFPDIPCELYAIPVTRQQRLIFEHELEHFKLHRSMYSYSLIGMGTVLFQISLHRRNKYVCSQFVAHVIEQSGISLPKPSVLCTPEDLRHIPGAQLIYQGELNDYVNHLFLHSFIGAVSAPASDMPAQRTAQPGAAEPLAGSGVSRA